jgi:uncharacterized membrane protein
VSLYDWLLFLHVLSAFSLVAGLVLYTYVIVAARRADRPAAAARSLRLLRVGDPLWAVGAGGTLALGIWLAIDVDGYELWDGWIIAALVLWLAAGGTGDRMAKHYGPTRERAVALVAEGRDELTPELREMLRSPRGLTLHALTVGLILLLLLDMIWKPGA